MQEFIKNKGPIPEHHAVNPLSSAYYFANYQYYGLYSNKNNSVCWSKGGATQKYLRFRIKKEKSLLIVLSVLGYQFAHISSMYATLSTRN